MAPRQVQNSISYDREKRFQPFLKKVPPSFPAATFLKLRSCQDLLFGNLVEGSTPLAESGVHIMPW